MPLPVLAAYDLILIGSSSAAVSAAITASDQGASVLLVSPVPYLGEDLGATLWPQLSGNPISDPVARRLVSRVFGQNQQTVQVWKESLEREALHAGVHLLYDCRPAGVVLDDAGAIAGICLASRLGLQVFRAKSLIDASLGAVVARQTGCSFRGLGPQRVEVSWTNGSLGEESTAGKTLRWKDPQGSDKVLSLRETKQYSILNLDDPRSLAQIESNLRDQAFFPEQTVGADSLHFQSPRQIVTTKTMDAAACLAGRVEGFCAKDGLWVLSPAADLSENAVNLFENFDQACALGSVVAKAALENPGKVKDTACSVKPSPGAKMCPGFTSHPRDLRGNSWNAAVIPDLSSLPHLGAWDVVVVGGGTAGPAAGIAAAREGKRVLVLERLPVLGGLGTAGQISKYYYGYRHGFTKELDEAVAAMGPASLRPEREGTWRVEWKQAAWLRLLKKAGAELWTHTLVAGVSKDSDRITGLIVAGPSGIGWIQATCVIDSTGASDIAAFAGAPVVEVGTQDAAVQGTGLSPKNPGAEYSNSDHTFSDDGDLVDATACFVAARRKFRPHFDLGQIIATRERRRIQGEVVVEPQDILSDRQWPDAIITAESNFDSHGFTVHPLLTIEPPSHKPYRAMVPLRALLPQGVKNLLVTGLAISAHRDSLPVLRMQPCVQNQGFAAGLIAAAACEFGGDPRRVPLGQMQKRLQAIGVLEHLPTKTLAVTPSDIDACIASGALDYREIGILLGHPDLAAPKLVQALQSDSDPVRSRRFALILAFLGDARSAPYLAKMLKESSLDRGWNYCGMDQFGPSRSPTDSLLHAIAVCPDSQFLEPLIALTKDWTTNALWSNGLEFSHVLALSKACAAMVKFDTEKQLLPILARVLWFHGTNVIDSWDELFANQPRDTNHNESRNRALRELVLLAGILACGDQKNQARDRLIRYTGDWRGPLARYARQVLEQSVV